MYIYIYILVGGFNPSEKYESQLGLLLPRYGKNQIHVPKHQPDENCRLGALNAQCSDIYMISKYKYIYIYIYYKIPINTINHCSL